MNNYIKLAYEAGAQQALEDSGLSKQAGFFTPTNEKRLARQLVEGGWFGRLGQPIGYGLGGAALMSGVGGLAGAGAAGAAHAAHAGSSAGAWLSSLVGAPLRGNRLADEVLSGNSSRYADTGIPEARRRAVARGVLAEGGGRKAIRQLIKVPLSLGGMALGGLVGAAPGIAVSAGGVPVGPALAGAGGAAGMASGWYGGHRAAHKLMPVHIPAETRLEALRGRIGNALSTRGGKATALAALLGAGALGYNALSGD